MGAKVTKGKRPEHKTIRKELFEELLGKKI